MKKRLVICYITLTFIVAFCMGFIFSWVFEKKPVVIEKEKIVFTVKSGKDGKIFGTISSKQISEGLKKMGYMIDKKDIVMDHVIDTLGTHKVVAKVHKKVEIILTIVVC